MRRKLNWKAPAITLLAVLTLCSLAGSSGTVGTVARYTASATYTGGGRVARWGPPTRTVPVPDSGDQCLKFHQNNGNDQTRTYTNGIKINNISTAEVWLTPAVGTPATLVTGDGYRGVGTYGSTTFTLTIARTDSGNIGPGTSANYTLTVRAQGGTNDGCALYKITGMKATQVD